ncbi:MAG: BON domain-containing protein [Chitinophagaceae bacterium]
MKYTEQLQKAEPADVVNAVVEKLEIQTAEQAETDDDIALAVLNAIKWNWQVPDDRIKVTVKNGWISLEGELDYAYQRNAAENSIVNIMGVLGVFNGISIRSGVADAVGLLAIERAFSRNWSIIKKGIKIEVKGHKVVLSGTVGSVYDREQAGRIALNDPGTLSVSNELVVAFDD